MCRFVKVAFESKETLHSLVAYVRVSFYEPSLYSVTKKERFTSFAMMSSATHIACVGKCVNKLNNPTLYNNIRCIEVTNCDCDSYIVFLLDVGLKLFVARRVLKLFSTVLLMIENL